MKIRDELTQGEAQYPLDGDMHISLKQHPIALNDSQKERNHLWSGIKCFIIQLSYTVRIPIF